MPCSMHITISLFVATKLIIYQRLVLSFYKLTILYLAIPTEVIKQWLLRVREATSDKSQTYRISQTRSPLQNKIWNHFIAPLSDAEKKAISEIDDEMLSYD